MLQLLTALFYPIVSLIILILGSGFFTTFVSVRLGLEGASNELIGVVTSAFYTGILLGSFRSPRWISRIGHLRVLVALCAASSAFTLGMSLWTHPLFWALLRFLSGVAMGGLFVVIESWFLLLSRTDMRGQALSVYLAVFYMALSIGQFFIGTVDPTGFTPFCISGGLSALAILPIVIFDLQLPQAIHAETGSFWDVFRASGRGCFGGIVSGMLLSAIYGLGPAYAEEIGLSGQGIATFMFMIIFGGLCLQWPLGKLADLTSRRGTLILAALGAAIFSAFIGVLDTSSWSSLMILCWLFGGFSFVVYPLSMAFTCEGIDEKRIVAATGGFVLAYGIGAIIGPLIAPLFMGWSGPGGLFYFLALICLTLAIISLIPSPVPSKEED